MNTLLGVISTEFKMSIKRWGLIIFYVLLLAFYVGTWLDQTTPFISDDIAGMWSDSAMLTFSVNLFLPVLAGILAADRLVRDRKLNTQELLNSSQLSPGVYVWGKYFGVLLSLALPAVILNMIFGSLFVLSGYPWELIPMLLVASLTITLPSLIFITAFSIICPLLMPVRVYQILFTGYWYWGNYLNPEFIPSISDTILNACGKYMISAFYGVNFGRIAYSRPEAILNVTVLVILAAAAVIFGQQLLIRQARKA